MACKAEPNGNNEGWEDMTEGLRQDSISTTNVQKCAHRIVGKKVFSSLIKTSKAPLFVINLFRRTLKY